MRPARAARRRPGAPRRPAPAGPATRAAAAQPQRQPAQPAGVAGAQASPGGRPSPSSVDDLDRVVVDHPARPPGSASSVTSEVVRAGREQALVQVPAQRASGGGVPSTSSTSMPTTRSSRNSRTASARWHQPSRYQRPSTFSTRIGSTSRSVVSSRLRHEVAQVQPAVPAQRVLARPASTLGARAPRPGPRAPSRRGRRGVPAAASSLASAGSTASRSPSPGTSASVRSPTSRASASSTPSRSGRAMASALPR